MLPECTITNVDEDSWRHSLIDCRMAHCVWAHTDEELTDVIISNCTMDPKFGHVESLIL